MSRIADATYGNELAPYPNSPGFKEPTTSRDAAKAIQSKAMTLRQRVYVEIVGAGSIGLTPDECAALLGETVLAIRPRVSELAAKDWIVPTGMRRTNASGLKAKAYRNNR